jgi:galactitol-specific phosphotransferase system IIB component
MDKKEKSEKVLNIIKEYKNSSNKDLVIAMNHLQEDFEFTKNMVLKGAEQIDRIETTYNMILKEYQKRMNPNDNR